MFASAAHIAFPHGVSTDRKEEENVSRLCRLLLHADTREETAKRVMFFYFGNQLGQASSKLLAYGILHMRGVGGKAGWFW